MPQLMMCTRRYRLVTLTLGNKMLVPHDVGFVRSHGQMVATECLMVMMRQICALEDEIVLQLWTTYCLCSILDQRSMWQWQTTLCCWFSTWTWNSLTVFYPCGTSHKCIWQYNVGSDAVQWLPQCHDWIGVHQTASPGSPHGPHNPGQNCVLK